jgi:hypothetical protein
MSVRFGLIVLPGSLQAWQAACVDALARESAQCDVVIRIDVSGAAERPRLASSEAPCGFGRRVYPSSERATQAASPTGDEIRCPVRESDGSMEIDDAVIARIESYGLDFALDFAQRPYARRFAPATRYGVWSIRFGDPPRSTAWRPGSWELLHGEPVVRAALVKSDAVGDSILKEGYVETTPHDAAATADAVRFAAARWPAQVWRETDIGAQPAGEGALQDVKPVEAPTRIQDIALAMRVAAASLGRRIRDALGEEHWYPGLVRRPIASFLAGSEYHVEWLPRSAAGRYAADPFGCAANGEVYAFCEEYDFLDKRGFLSVAALPRPGGDPFVFTPIMRTAHHLSYPYIIEYDGAIYCLPEASESGEVALYRARRFPFEWEKTAVLLAGFGGVDNTVVRHLDRWWMFCTSREAPNRELYIWFADKLEGPWSGHARNPVKCDVRSSRCAGTPFVENGILYRPAQDCAGSYGRRVVINAVRELTPSRFKEETVAYVAPNRRGPNPDGVHTLSAVGSWTLIDGKCRRFVLTEFVRRWNRLLGLLFGRDATNL